MFQINEMVNEHSIPRRSTLVAALVQRRMSEQAIIRQFNSIALQKQAMRPHIPAGEKPPGKIATIMLDVA